MLNKAEVDALMKSVADVMRDYVSKEVSEVRAEVKAVWAEFNSLPVPKDGENGKDGKDGESPDVQEVVDSLRGVASGMVSEGLEPFAEQIKELQEQVEASRTDELSSLAEAFVKGLSDENTARPA
jgi:hypothetical protein